LQPPLYIGFALVKMVWQVPQICFFL